MRILALPIRRHLAATATGNPSSHFYFFVQDASFYPSGSESSEVDTRVGPFRSRIDGWVAKASTKWEELGREKDGSWRRRIYSAGNRVMDKIDADEWFLKEVGHPSHVAEIVYPKGDDHSIIRDRVKALIDYRKPYHHKQRYLSAACIPLSIAMGILPGPNLFLAYNLFRLYSHDKALTGVDNLSRAQLDLQGHLRLADIVKDKQSDMCQDKQGDTHYFLTRSQMDAIKWEYDMPQYFRHDVSRASTQERLKADVAQQK